MKILILIVSTFTFTIWLSLDSNGVANKIHPELVWSDEFDYQGLPDANLWDYDLGNGCHLPCGCGWGNNELQYYTDGNPQNVRVEDGHLTISLTKDPDHKYTSAKIHTKHSASWKYGTIEVKAKAAKGLGAWSAIWMMPLGNKYGGWPKSGEIDIMEQVGYAQDTVWSAVHVDAYNGMHGTHKNGQSYVPDVAEEYHIYKLVWTKDKYETFIDGKHNFTYVNEHKGSEKWPFDQEFYLILNLAYGGNWGGKKGTDDSLLPMEMHIDYVRVYQ